VANFFASKGFSRGASVALFMENRPEYVAIWLGLAKVGLVPALINSNLRLQALLHTIKVAKAVGVVYGAELQDGETFDQLLCLHVDVVTCSVSGAPL
jgi:solute carrier family 27 (fatty acid transporter), member 1/4